ncbi:MAG: succinylglutamate desuccinylase [Hyphomicrobiales bacterium]|nr:MAG: succinylglutamate desuccinylase [Hyphomicrobiales bacterium]
MPARASFIIGNERIAPGNRSLIDLPVAKLANHTPVTLPVHVLHGRREGPVLFVSAAIHGDEVLGVEIIRRLLKTKSLKSLRGTLLCIPIVNAYGFLNHNRYLPDRRDLNRVFPGSSTGSLASRLAHIFMNEIVLRADLGVDLHTGSVNRANLPQLRSDFTDPDNLALARAFGPPLLLNASLREGSLRAAAHAVGKRVFIYEAGEALRLDETPVRVGVKGILRLMKKLGMLAAGSVKGSEIKPILSMASQWVRAPEGGLFKGHRANGDSVETGDLLGMISNPYELDEVELRAGAAGLVIGRTNLAVVNQGDALFHIARVKKPDEAGDQISQIVDDFEADPILDEDEIL